MLKNIVLKKSVNTSYLIYLTISYIIKKFEFMFKQSYKNVIYSFIYLLNFRENIVLIK